MSGLTSSKSDSVRPHAAKTFSEIALGLGAVGSLVVGVAALGKGERLVASGAFIALVFLVAATAFLISRRNSPHRVERRFVLAPGEYHVVPVDCARRAVLNGRLQANGPVSFWVLDDENLRRYSLDRRFHADDSGEGLLDATIRCEADAGGPLSVVVENDNEEEDVEVTIGIDVARAR